MQGRNAEEHKAMLAASNGDNEFATLRRKLLRFANDRAKAIAEIEPTFPAGFNQQCQRQLGIVVVDC
jgi:hypothetical protein